MVFSKFFKRIINFRRNQEGATSVEYAIMLALIISVCLLAIGSVGGESNELWDSNSEEISEAFDR